MAFREVPLSPDDNRPLSPGLYRFKYAVKSGDPATVTITELQAAFSKRFGGNARVYSWKAAQDKRSLDVIVEVLQPPKASSAEAAMMPSIAAVPVVITIVAIIAALSALVIGWKLYLDARPSVFALIPEEERAPVAKVQAASSAIVAGVVGLLAFWLFYRRKEPATT